MPSDGTRWRFEVPITIRFCVLWIVVVMLVEACLVWWFSCADQKQQRTIIFGASLFAATVAIFGLLQAAENIRRSNYEKRTAASSRFLERWNDPVFADLKVKWRTLNIEVDKLGGRDLITEHLEDNLQSQMIVVDMLNFFEEIAIAIDTQAASEDLLKRYFRTIVVKANKRYSAWIKVHRVHREAPRYWIEVEALMERWAEG